MGIAVCFISVPVRCVGNTRTVPTTTTTTTTAGWPFFLHRTALQRAFQKPRRRLSTVSRPETLPGERPPQGASPSSHVGCWMRRRAGTYVHTDTACSRYLPNHPRWHSAAKNSFQLSLAGGGPAEDDSPQFLKKRYPPPLDPRAPSPNSAAGHPSKSRRRVATKRADRGAPGDSDAPLWPGNVDALDEGG